MSWRSKIRSFHRDVGYLIIGFTIIYSISGIAVNHIGQWDANFSHFERNIALPEDLTIDDGSTASSILKYLRIDEAPLDIYDSESELQIVLSHQEITIDKVEKIITIRGQESRLLLRVMNWLHLNRGKRAWTIFADTYAVLLLSLAITGLFMIPDNRRRWIAKYLWVMAGISIPVCYIILSGGP